MQKVRMGMGILTLGICLMFSGCKGEKTEQTGGTDRTAESESRTQTQPEGSGQPVYRILDREQVEGDFSNYGELRTEHEEFQNEQGQVYFYYDIECAEFDETFPGTVNETLQAYYAAVKEQYLEDAEVYAGGVHGEAATAAAGDSLLFQYVAYAGEDYVSLVYNNVSYMGGAHPYSALEGITIDCATGELLPLSHFLDASEEEIGAQLKKLLELDDYTVEEWDYYITENSVVLFYYDPRYWDSVEIKGVR